MSKTNFELVSQMNVAFGNPKGSPQKIDYDKVRKQCLNIIDETAELLVALGASPSTIRHAVSVFKTAGATPVAEVEAYDVRDALCDIHVFAYGAHHLMGIDADADMQAVVSGVMTRFIKNEADREATVTLHATKGVTKVYYEGVFPTMVMKSLVDQPDAPKGKFLKSASYFNTVMPPV